MKFTIQTDDPSRAEVVSLLQTHLAFAAAHTPAGSGHALDVSALMRPEITFWTARDETGAVIGCVAMKELSPDHGEIKSMHTLEAHRGKGVARTLLETVMKEAKMRGLTRLSLETGKSEGFGPSRLLYERMGFAACEAFGDYGADPFSYCMSREIGGPD